jgi:hypothetical protein
MNLCESFTLCPASPSNGGNERQNRVIPGTIRRDWGSTREHRRFEIIPEAGLGIRASPFEMTVTTRNMPVNGTISTSYLEMQRRLPPMQARYEQHGASQSMLMQENQPPPQIIVLNECHDQLAVVNNRDNNDESSIESSFTDSRDEYEYDDDMREDAAPETRENLKRPCAALNRHSEGFFFKAG